MNKKIVSILIIYNINFLYATIYENGEMGKNNWQIYDNLPKGAVIKNIYDESKKSNVIEFRGKGRKNSYQLGARFGNKAWKNHKEKILKWSMKTTRKYKLSIYLKTKKGNRYLNYTYHNKSTGLQTKVRTPYIHHGLGEKSIDGKWHPYQRNLERDLKQYEPDNSIYSIEGIRIEGNIRIDDIELIQKKYPELFQKKYPELFPKKYTELFPKKRLSNINRHVTIKHYAPITREKLIEMLENNKNVSDVNTSYITNMSYLFAGYPNFNQDISNWNVSNVTNMNHMFNNAKKFNQNINNWDISNVNDMGGMFQNAEVFNQPLEKWDVSNVTNMAEMFSGAKAFNQPLESWDISNVRHIWSMFENATSFNQPLEKWNIINIIGTDTMFAGAKSFNQPLNKWDVSNISDMSSMFEMSGFNQPLESWNISNVKYMDSIFDNSKMNPLPTWYLNKMDREFSLTL